MSNPCFQRPFGETALTFSPQIQHRQPAFGYLSPCYIPASHALRHSENEAVSLSQPSFCTSKKKKNYFFRKKKKKGVRGMGRKGAPQDGHQAAMVEKSDHEVLPCVDSS